MSKIDAQIKELQVKKKKVDYIAYVLDILKGDTKCIDFKDVQNEMIAKIEPFLNKLVEAIENGTEVNASEPSLFTEEEQKILKLVANKALAKSPQQPTQVSGDNTVPPAPPKPRTPEATGDKMNFALNNRHLGNKRVQVMNDENVTINGVVVGLDAPHVLVKTDTGPTIQVPLDKVVLL